MKKLCSLLSLCFVFAHASSVFAQGPGSAGVLFLLITPGARSAGMGESFVSVADDANATYWNPAGMAFQDRMSISLMYAKWLPQLADDLHYNYASAVKPINGLGTAGLAVTFISLGEQIITGENDPTELGRFSSYELAVAGSFGTKLGANNAAGVALKFIYSNLSPKLDNTSQKGDGNATAFALDLSYMHKNLLVDYLNLGVNLTNLGPKITYVDAAQADPLPTNLRIGLSYQLVRQEFNRLTLATEVNRLLIAFDDEGKALNVIPGIFKAFSDEDSKAELRHFIYNVGAEYWYNNFVALRTGYHYDQDGRAKYVSFGAGLKYSSLNLDFGYISAGEGHPLSDTMRFSLGIGL